MFEPGDWIPDDQPPFGPGASERELALNALSTLNPDWRRVASAITLGPGLAWTPDLVAKDRHALFLSLGGLVPRAFARRMEAARRSGWKITVAVGTTDLDIDTLLALQQLDARLVMLALEEDSGELKLRTYRSVADWIAMERVALSVMDFQVLIRERLRHADDEPTSVKGRLFEEALCLLFNQARWLRVEEHSFNNQSEEIDLVLSVHAAGDLAGLAKGPIAIATAKNEKKATDSATVKYLKGQMANRRNRCNLGFLCSAGTISPEAGLEILRGSGSDALVVQLSRVSIDHLIEHASDLGASLADHVRRAASL